MDGGSCQLIQLRRPVKHPPSRRISWQLRVERGEGNNCHPGIGPGNWAGNERGISNGREVLEPLSNSISAIPLRSLQQAL
jgi:hypothetical protein